MKKFNKREADLFSGVLYHNCIRGEIIGCYVFERNNNLLLTEGEGHTESYWPEVVANIPQYGSS